jgi:putative endonuclease
METKNWYVYMVECSDGTIYTGITNNIAERIIKHNTGKGAKYTRARNPVILKAYWPYKQKAEAAKAEYAFKKLTRIQKMELISRFNLKGSKSFLRGSAKK